MTCFRLKLGHWLRRSVFPQLSPPSILFGHQILDLYLFGRRHPNRDLPLPPLCCCLQTVSNSLLSRGRRPLQDLSSVPSPTKGRRSGSFTLSGPKGCPDRHPNYSYPTISKPRDHSCPLRGRRIGPIGRCIIRSHPFFYGCICLTRGFTTCLYPYSLFSLVILFSCQSSPDRQWTYASIELLTESKSVT